MALVEKGEAVDTTFLQSRHLPSHLTALLVRPAWVLSLGLKSRTDPLVGTVSELQGVMW